VRTMFSEAHEATGEVVVTIDQAITDFLEHFYQKGYLEDTFITILSDHGAHGIVLRTPFLPDNSRHLENYYPVLFHVTKKDISKEAQQFLSENQQAFVSSFDIYQTLRSIALNTKVSNFPDQYCYFCTKIPGNHDCHNGSMYRD